MRSALLCAALLALTGCQTLAPQTQIPESLLTATPHPVVDVRTNGGLTQALTSYKAALDAANDDKDAIRVHLSKKETP